MKNENLINDSINSIFVTDLLPDESITCEGFEKYCKIRDEMKKYMHYLNQCNSCNSIHSQIHYLYMSLFHLDRMEIEFFISNLSDEMLHQEKIIEDLRSLKLMVLNYIRDLSEELNY